jgi:N-acetylglucosaminyl-diphospho-decaprenol L-rhamnosyltransferase
MSNRALTDVVIVNHNSGQALKRCLTGLLGEADPAFRVWVVDNASADDSLQGLPISPQLKVIRNADNPGFATACNQGMQAGEAECVVFLNPDCFAKADDLNCLRQSLFNEPKAALMGCRVLNEDGSLQAATRRRLPTFLRMVLHVTRLGRLPGFTGINIHDQGRFPQPIEVEAINGALMMGRRRDLETVDGFDEAFPLHFEDLDLFARLRQQGRSVMYDSAIEVVHLKGISRQDSQRIKNWKRLGLRRYMHKHRPGWESRLVNWLFGAK